MFQNQENFFSGPGTSTLTDYTVQILLMFLVAFLLAWLFWYLWNRGRYNARIEALEREIADLKAQIAALENDLKDCRSNRSRLQSDYDALQSRYNKLILEQAESGEADVTTATASISGGGAGIDFNAAFKSDNLQVVEGIGPKIESILKEAGVNTWALLAGSDKDALKNILLDKSARYRIHDPTTWPKQADMANRGSWDELVEYQKFLGGGKEDSSTVASDLSKIEKMAVKILGITLYKPTDLKVVEGIGPKTELLLKDNGITNWSELAETAVETLQSIIDSAGSRFRLLDPGTWPEQARMAASGQWRELEKYQDYLQGGKDMAKG